METNKILQGHALDVLRTLPNESIDCIMTSPPYWALRDYGLGKDQLGLEPTFDLYVKHLCDIFDETKRTLKKSGTCWVNIGDTYAGSMQGYGAKENSKTGFQKAPVNTGYNASSRMKPPNAKAIYHEDLRYEGRGKTKEVPSKSLCLIPFRFAIQMVNRGWILRNTIIWHKPNCMPSSIKDRFTVDFEYLFFFVKNKKYYFEVQYEPHLSSSKERGKYGLSKASAFDYSKRERSKWKENSIQHRGIKNPDWLNPLGRNKRTVWTITTHGFPGAHFATYPEELCEIPIKAGCPQDGIVLDPFFGSGTTGLVALKQNKKFIGIELNPEYIKIAKERLKPYLEQMKL